MRGLGKLQDQLWFSEMLFEVMLAGWIKLSSTTYHKGQADAVVSTPLQLNLLSTARFEEDKINSMRMRRDPSVIVAPQKPPWMKLPLSAVIRSMEKQPFSCQRPLAFSALRSAGMADENNQSAKCHQALM